MSGHGLSATGLPDHLRIVTGERSDPIGTAAMWAALLTDSGSRAVAAIVDAVTEHTTIGAGAAAWLTPELADLATRYEQTEDLIVDGVGVYGEPRLRIAALSGEVLCDRNGLRIVAGQATLSVVIGDTRFDVDEWTSGADVISVGGHIRQNNDSEVAAALTALWAGDALCVPAGPNRRFGWALRTAATALARSVTDGPAVVLLGAHSD